MALVVPGCASSAEVAVEPPGAAAFALAPVLDQRAATTCGTGEVADGPGRTCYVLGGAAVGAGDVVRADARRDGLGGDWKLHVVLGDDGLVAFAALAADCVAGRPRCPLGQVAVVVAGRVALAPSPVHDRFTSPELVISGPIPLGFDEPTATRLAAAVQGAVDD